MPFISFQRSIQTYLGWLIEEYALTLQPPGPETLVESSPTRVYVCNYSKVTLCLDKWLVQVCFAASTDQGSGYEAGCVISFVERKYRKGVYSGTLEEQMEKISSMLKPHAKQLLGSNFLSAKKEELDEFRVKWLRRAHYGPQIELF